MLDQKEQEKAIELAHELGVTLEIFPMWPEEEFVRFIKEHSSVLRGIVSSFHEPFHFCEHSARHGSREHQETLDTCRRTFECAANLGAKHMVFHHNNRQVTPAVKEDMIKYSRENLHEMNEIAAEYKIPYLVENAGVVPWHNMLFTEDEFIALFDEIDNDCLLDIGHVHCNGWDLQRIMNALSGRIAAYHVHNNDGIYDSHKRVTDGTITMAAFIHLCNKLTPGAQIILEYARGTKVDIVGLRDDIRWFR